MTSCLPSTVQSRRVISQLEQNLFHLERSRQSLDQNGTANRVVRYADVRLGEEEYVVPKTSFQVVLHLRQVEIGAAATFDELLRIVVEVQGEVEERCRHWSIIDSDARFVQVPSTRPRYSQFDT